VSDTPVYSTTAEPTFFTITMSETPVYATSTVSKPTTFTTVLSEISVYALQKY